MKEELRGAGRRDSPMVSRRRGSASRKHVGEMERLAEEDSFIIQDLLNETVINIAP